MPHLGYLYLCTSKKSKNKLVSKVKIKMTILFFLQVHALFLFSDLWFNWEKSTLSNTIECSSKHEMIALIKWLTENFNLFSFFFFPPPQLILVFWFLQQINWLPANMDTLYCKSYDMSWFCHQPELCSKERKGVKYVTFQSNGMFAVAVTWCIVGEFFIPV